MSTPSVTSNAHEATPSNVSDKQSRDSSTKAASAHAALSSKESSNEEPGLVLEADLPSDGIDEVGETMIRNLPQRAGLSK